MDSKEFSAIRHSLEKSQAQIAQILGVSSRSVQSFEQGWRRVPVSVERQMLFLKHKKVNQKRQLESCWKMNECDPVIKNKCPAWEFQTGDMCWFINGTICSGKTNENWKQKMKICRQCEYFSYLFSN